MDSRAIWEYAIGKIVLASLVQLPYLLLMQLFPNRTQIHVITHTDYIEVQELNKLKIKL